jgi:hypothetical protein
MLAMVNHITVAVVIFAALPIRCISLPHPLLATGMYTQTEYDHVTIQYFNGKLQKEYLQPGLAFTPMRLFGHTYRTKKVRADTDCFHDISAQTSDPTNYKVSVCVTNLVRPEDMVDVINKTSFDYDTLTLKGQTENAVKEVFIDYTLMQVEVEKANQLNEDIKRKIGEELLENFGEVGKKIQVLNVVVKKKEVDSFAASQMGKIALVKRAARTDELNAQLRIATFEVNKIKSRAESSRTEMKVRHQNRVQKEVAQAENRKQELWNAGNLSVATTASKIAEIRTQAEKDITTRMASLFDEFPDYARHERAIAYTSALSNNAKYILTDSMNEQMQSSLSGERSSWLFGGAANAGTCQGSHCLAATPTPKVDKGD